MLKIRHLSRTAGLGIALALTHLTAMATPTPVVTPAWTCGTGASTGFGPLARCTSVLGEVASYELRSNVTCDRSPEGRGKLVGARAQYSGTSISSDKTGTFNFFGGPQIATPYGPASFGEQRKPATATAKAMVRWGNFNFIANQFSPSSVWTQDSGGYVCPEPAAPFDFPDFFPGGGALHGVDATFALTAPIPGNSVLIKNPNMGVVRINAFISTPQSCAFPLCFYGNNRGFDPYAEARVNKVAIELTFVTGSGHIYVAETCRPSGLPSCLDPRPLRQVTDPYDPRFKDQNYTNWYFFVVPDGQGNASIQIGFVGTNSFTPPISNVGCSINQNHVLYWNATTSKMQFNGSLMTDEYPSREIYWYPPNAIRNGRQPYVTLAQVRESGSPAGTPGLCTFAP